MFSDSRNVKSQYLRYSYLLEAFWPILLLLLAVLLTCLSLAVSKLFDLTVLRGANLVFAMVSWNVSLVAFYCTPFSLTFSFVPGKVLRGRLRSALAILLAGCLGFLFYYCVSTFGWSTIDQWSTHFVEQVDSLFRFGNDYMDPFPFSP